jgi:hypothetical protein
MIVVQHGVVDGSLRCLGVESNKLEIVELVVSRNQSREFLNAFHPRLGTPLCNAWQNVGDDITRFILSQSGIDPSIHDHQLKTPLTHASEHGNLEVVKALIDFFGDGTGSRWDRLASTAVLALQSIPCDSHVKRTEPAKYPVHSN